MYKRNQVEGAIARATGKTRGPDYSPAQELITRLKRLTEIDRSVRVDRRAAEPAFRRFAFFDEAPPGRGAEVSYSAYAAFALFLAVRLMDAGFPQSAAVALLRRVRPDLEAEHGRILRRKPESLLDHPAPKGLELELRNGRLVRRIGNMVFLLAAVGDPWPVHRRDEAGEPSSANICRGPKRLAEVMESLALPGGFPVVSIELVNASHQLAYWLERIEPIRRGRK
jgi:hypothetical protein